MVYVHALLSEYFTLPIPRSAMDPAISNTLQFVRPIWANSHANPSRIPLWTRANLQRPGLYLDCTTTLNRQICGNVIVRPQTQLLCSAHSYLGWPASVHTVHRIHTHCTHSLPTIVRPGSPSLSMVPCALRLQQTYIACCLFGSRYLGSLGSERIPGGGDPGLGENFPRSRIFTLVEL